MKFDMVGVVGGVRFRRATVLCGRSVACRASELLLSFPLSCLGMDICDGDGKIVTRFRLTFQGLSVCP